MGSPRSLFSEGARKGQDTLVRERCAAENDALLFGWFSCSTYSTFFSRYNVPTKSVAPLSEFVWSQLLHPGKGLVHCCILIIRIPIEFFCWYFVGMVSPSFGGTFAIPVSAAVQSKTSNHTGGNSWSKAREQHWLRSFSLLIEFNIRYGDWCRRQNCGTSLDHTSQSSQFHKDRKSTCTQLRENTTLVSFKALAVALKS